MNGKIEVLNAPTWWMEESMGPLDDTCFQQIQKTLQLQNQQKLVWKTLTLKLCDLVWSKITNERIRKEKHMRHATIINTGLQQGVSSYTMFVENRLLSSSSVSILQRLQYLFAPWTCLPKHSFDPTFFGSLSSNQSSMLWNFQPRARASLLLRVHQQQNQLQRNNPGDGGLHDRWHTYLQSRLRLRCCSFERKVDAGCFATIGAFHSKISIRRSAKDALDKALTPRKTKQEKLHILKIAP